MEKVLTSKEEMKVGSESWIDLQSEIINRFAPGDTIAHEWLKSKFNFKNLKFRDFDNEFEFIKAVQLQQFAYMSLIDSLRWELLENNKVYLRNIRGDGYTILPPSEQCMFAYDKALDQIKKEIKEADLIMSNTIMVGFEQQSKDNDLRARWSMLKQLLQSVKKSK